MRLIDKVAKGFTPAFYLSAWRAIGRALHPQPVGKFLRHLDPALMPALRARHEHTLRPGENWTKYFDAPRWLALNIRRAQDIGIDREKRPLRVLDLGSGAGYFLFVCRHLGHEGMGIDVPEPAFYGEMFEKLGLPRVVSSIDPQTPLPEPLLSGGKFDLVTAFSVSFDRYGPQGLWNVSDWSFLLDDLRDRFLKPGGRIYIDMNPHYDGEFMTPGMKEMFLRRGAQIDRRSKLLFNPLKLP